MSDTQATYFFKIKIYKRKSLEISQELQVRFLKIKRKLLQKLLCSVLLACGISRSLQDHPIYPNYQAGFSHLLPMPHDLLTLQSALSHTK